MVRFQKQKEVNNLEEYIESYTYSLGISKNIDVHYIESSKQLKIDWKYYYIDEYHIEHDVQKAVQNYLMITDSWTVEKPN